MLVRKRLKKKIEQICGTYVVMEGPQFSTLAESNLYRSWKADVIGMTNMPEAKAREVEIRYASVSMVTDYDCWHPDHENVDATGNKVLLGNATKAKNMIKNLIENFENYIDPKDPTNNCLDVAIITAPEKRTKTIDKIKTVAGRVLTMRIAGKEYQLFGLKIQFKNYWSNKTPTSVHYKDLKTVKDAINAIKVMRWEEHLWLVQRQLMD